MAGAERRQTPTLPPGRLERRLWLGATAYLLLNAIGLGLLSATADQDQAEQLVLAQHWAPGYGPQPPLYTYLVKLLFLPLGPGLAPLLALKAALLSLLVAAVLAIGRELRFRAEQQLFALAGLALIPQFIWEAQRDLTHSVLATTVAAATLLQLLRLSRLQAPGQPRRSGPWLLLGVLLGAGLLSKYSVVLFQLGLLLSSLTIPALRRTLLRPGLLLTAAAALVVLAPHLAWMLQHSALALGGLDKAQAVDGLGWRGLGSALQAAVAFLSPFWLVALLVLWPERRRLQLASASQEPQRALLQRLPLVVLAVVLVAVLASGASRIKDRWYQSLLFSVPISTASLLPPGRPQRLRWLLGAGVGAAAAAALVLPGRTALAGLSGKSSRPNQPLPELVRSLVQAAGQGAAGQPDLVVASSGLLAGNARLALPQVPVVTPRLLERQGPMVLRAGPAPLVLLLVDEGDAPSSLEPVLRQLGCGDWRPEQLQNHSLPLRWAPQQQHRFRNLAA